MKKQIAIIVPVYKVEKYVTECIESILAQTYTDFRLILVDDGTPDNAGKICDEYAEKDERISVIHCPPNGLSDGRNRGIEVARGDFLSFIDSDDFLREDMLEKLINIALDTNSDVVICNYYLYYNDKNYIKFMKNMV